MRLKAVLILVFFSFVNAEKLKVYFFGSETCSRCFKIKEEILYPLQKKYPEKMELIIKDIDKEEDLILISGIEAKFNITEPMPIELFFADTFLLDGDIILKESKHLLEKYLVSDNIIENINPDEFGKDNSKVLNVIKERLGDYVWLNIIFLGIVDGVNPCAIATIIFLISYLALKKRGKKEILLTGTFFTLAVFLTYFLLGLGAFKLITGLKVYHYTAIVVRWLAVLFALIISILSFYDAFSYSKTRDSKKIKLQLPEPVKKRINKVISANLSGKSLIIGSFVTGFLVTLLEAVCTGQVYIPAIVLMTKQEGAAFQGWMYLVVYNLLFVLPLIIIMIMAYLGMTWDFLVKKTQNNMVLLKILIGTALLFLAVSLYFVM